MTTPNAPSESPLKIPAMILIALALMWGVGLMFMTILQVAGVVNPSQGVNVGGPIPNLIVSVFVLIYYAAIAGGAFMSMMRPGGSKTVAWIVAIAASVPCCSPCVFLGMIPGIWSIVLLMKPEVSATLK